MGFKCWFIILHGHIFSHVIKHTRDLSLLLGLYDRHAILNLKVLLEIRQHFFLSFFFFSSLFGFCCETNHRRREAAVQAAVQTDPVISNNSASHCQPAAIRHERHSRAFRISLEQSPKWDLKKSSNLQMMPNKRLFVRKNHNGSYVRFYGFTFTNESFFTFYSKKEY